MNERKSGILLHITSLPSEYGIGDFGPEAHRFVDFLKNAHQKYWQILPLTPTNPMLGNSPYSSCSVFAGNTLLISPDRLIKEKFISKTDVESSSDFSKERVNYESVTKFKNAIFQIAFEKNKKTIVNDKKFNAFCGENTHWLEDYSFYIALKNHFNNSPWYQWPVEIRKRQQEAMSLLREELKENILKEKFLQFLFFKQWMDLKEYCQEQDVQIIGDIPIYVYHDGVDVWTNPEFFKLDEYLNLKFVTGVPPDYFSTTGQRWGNPVYDWDKMAETDFSWWVKRLQHNLNVYDIVRIDHFRGLVNYWEIPVRELNAVNGHWVDVPHEALFKVLSKNLPKNRIIAEDLGIISQEVKDVMDAQNLPGMKILLFAFNGDVNEHPYIPEQYQKKCIAYTGTHDNNTIHGWYNEEMTEQEENNLLKYLKISEINLKTLHWDLITCVSSSIANTVIFPIQDVLGLDEHARFNTPSHAHGNWEWRLSCEALTNDIENRLAALTKTTNRN